MSRHWSKHWCKHGPNTVEMAKRGLQIVIQSEHGGHGQTWSKTGPTINRPTLVQNGQEWSEGVIKIGQTCSKNGPNKLRLGPKRSKTRSNLIQPCPKSSKIGPKMVPNGSKHGHTCSTIGPGVVPTWYYNGPTWSQNGPKMVPNRSKLVPH